VPQSAVGQEYFRICQSLTRTRSSLLAASHRYRPSNYAAQRQPGRGLAERRGGADFASTLAQKAPAQAFKEFPVLKNDGEATGRVVACAQASLGGSA